MFKITEYLDRLNNVKHHMTWGQAECPVCQGTLKFSKSGGKQDSYACYTNYCHERRNEYGVNLIKQKLAPFNGFAQSNQFNNQSYFKSDVKLMPIPMYVTDQVNLLSDVPYIRPTVVTNVRKNERKIVFRYEDFVAVRIERYTHEGYSKYFYPLHSPSLDTKEMVKGLPDTDNLSVIYREAYVQPDIILVEGEKCASTLQKLGYAAISIYTSFISSMTLSGVLRDLKDKGVRNIVFLSDNDVAGQHKAHMFEEYAWHQHINLTNINLVDIYPEFKEYQGFDVADLYVEGYISSNREEFQSILQQQLDKNGNY
jgi:5S rRNA maturation endonuclease (ribonuclease M5)